MGIDYFNCETCGVEMSDCFCALIWWTCNGCDATYCDNCATGTWVSCKCSEDDYCPECVAAGAACSCGSFGCAACRGKAKVHSPGCPARGTPKAPGGGGAAKEMAETRRYPEPKRRELTDDEKARLRARIKRGDGDIYALAAEFGCSVSQVAGVKAAMHR